MDITKGGRGKKAPYKTSMVRTPEPLKPQIADLIEQYKTYVEDGGDADNPPNFTSGSKPVYEFNKDDLESLKKKYLASLRMGRQAAEYKRSKKAFDSIIDYLLNEGL